MVRQNNYARRAVSSPEELHGDRAGPGARRSLGALVPRAVIGSCGWDFSYSTAVARPRRPVNPRGYDNLVVVHVQHDARIFGAKANPRHGVPVEQSRVADHGPSRCVELSLNQQLTLG